MSEKAVYRVWRMGTWFFMSALLALAYFATYFATVMPADTLIRVRSGSTLTIKRGRPEPDFSLRYIVGPALPTGFWRTFFAPAWRVDRVIRPDVWRVKRAPTARRTPQSSVVLERTAIEAGTMK